MPIELPNHEPCPFCRILEGQSEWVCVFVHRSEKMASFINPRQYGKGGILVIPIRHAQLSWTCRAMKSLRFTGTQRKLWRPYPARSIRRASMFSRTTA